MEDRVAMTASEVQKAESEVAHTPCVEFPQRWQCNVLVRGPCQRPDNPTVYLQAYRDLPSSPDGGRVEVWGLFLPLNSLLILGSTGKLCNHEKSTYCHCLYPMSQA